MGDNETVNFVSTKEWDEGRVNGAFQRIGRHTFTGRIVPINSENEKAITEARMRRLERAAVKARIKSLTWLNEKTFTV